MCQFSCGPMSMRLSSTNKMMNTSRNQVAGFAKRRLVATPVNAVLQIVDFWRDKTGIRELANKRGRR